MQVHRAGGTTNAKMHLMLCYASPETNISFLAVETLSGANGGTTNYSNFSVILDNNRYKYNIVNFRYRLSAILSL
jgi:hypothetical protein